MALAGESSMNTPRATTVNTLIVTALVLCAAGVPIVGAYPDWIPSTLSAAAATAALILPLLLQITVALWRVHEQRQGRAMSARQSQNEALAILVSWIVVGIWRHELGAAAYAWAAPFGLSRWSRAAGLALFFAWGIAARKSMRAPTISTVDGLPGARSV